MNTLVFVAVSVMLLVILALASELLSCSVRATSLVVTPVDQIAFAGDCVQLNCSVEGKQPGQILRWIRGIVAISGDYAVYNVPGFSDGERASVIGETSRNVTAYNLRITEVSSVDAASYQCGLNLGTSYAFLSAAAQLTVIEGPECLSEGSSLTEGQLSVTEGQMTNLTCQATISDPPVSVSWGTSTMGQSESQVWSDRDKLYSRLYWTPSRNDRDAMFTCVMSHPSEHRQKACSLGPIDIQYGPVVDVTPFTHTVVSPGETIIFFCSVESNPAVNTFTWSINGVVVQTIPNGVSVQNGGQSLQIVIANGEYNGAMVACTAYNVVGSGSDESRVFVDLVDSTTGYDSGAAAAAGGGGSDSASNLSRLNISIVAGVASALVILAIAGSILIAYFVKMHQRATRARKRRYGDGFDLGNRTVVNPIAGDDDGTEIDFYPIESSNINIPSASNDANSQECASVQLAVSASSAKVSDNTAAASSGANTLHYAVPRKLPVPSHYAIPRKSSSAVEGATSKGEVAGCNQYETLANACSGNINNQQEEPRKKKNVEGLVYADLDLAKPTESGQHSKVVPKSANTVYAQIQIKH